MFRAHPPLRLLFALPLAAGTWAGASVPAIDFNTQIRPILNQNCTACHGGVKSAGEISFVYRDVVTKVGKKSGHRVIIPGDPEHSEMIARVSSTDKEYRMPPADHGAALPAEKIALLREWIKQGAKWQDHWAFVPPAPQAPPAIGSAQAGSIRGNIDRFIVARLAHEKLTPAPEASRAELLRRASLDLTGLPPTPEESAAFVADGAPDAFEKQVDRLLASPHFGERWASLWLDLARYADTKGYEKDDNRTVWQYRDWLIRAFNRNQPYDQFVIEQLAGDLLPNATIDQHIATAFHRQTQVNDEGGTDDEEYRIAAIIDRVATTWQVTSGVTFQCAQCHSHPYEPIRQEEYYWFFAIFNETRDADFRDEIPTLRIPDDPARNGDALRLRREVDALRHDVVSAGTRLEANGSPWKTEPMLDARASPEATVAVHDDTLEVDGTIASTVRYDVTLPVFALSGEPITALRFEGRAVEPEKAQHTPERGFIVTQIQIALSGPDGTVAPIEVGRFFPDTEYFTTITTKTLPKPAGVAQASPPAPDNSASGTPPLPEARKAGKAPAAKKKAAAPATKSGPAMPAAPEDVRDITLDFHFAANPTVSTPRWMVAALRQPLNAPPGSRLHVSLLHSRQITEKPAPLRRLQIAASADPRWSSLATDPEIARKAARVSEALAELAKIPGTDLPVMADLPRGEERQTRLFRRGNFLDKTGQPLTPAVPSLFPPMPKGEPVNRLTLARWFFQPNQPLTARVAVNRFWEQLFGTGIVATLEDFGSVGERPSHPELLDWLALHFERDLHWDTKALLREIVLSATYRQDAHATPAQLDRDPQNRLLARGPRQRLTAEMVRDQALAASGLLSAKMGGAPVMPPQPAGVWQTVYNNKDWVESKGEDRYRRAVYTFWKRSAAYPGFLSFDMPARDLCTARRTPTNTPLQALVTLNDVVYDEAADALAKRVEREAPDVVLPDARIAHAFELVISRPPSATEAGRLRKLYADELAAASALGARASRPPSAEKAGETQPSREAMAGETPALPANESPNNASKESPEHRALRDVAAAILNLDAAFVR